MMAGTDARKEWRTEMKRMEHHCVPQRNVGDRHAQEQPRDAPIGRQALSEPNPTERDQAHDLPNQHAAQDVDAIAIDAIE